MIYARLSDDQLFRQWLDGEDEAFRAFFDRVAPVVYRIARKQGLGEPESSDVVQQTFLAVHRAKNDFRRDAPVRPWLFTIAYNVVRQHYRSRAARPEVALELDGYRDPVYIPEELEGESEFIIDCVRDAVARLPEGQRRVIELHWFDRLPFAQVAAMVGSTDAAARVRAHRGYEKLRNWLSSTDSLHCAAPTAAMGNDVIARPRR